MIKFPTNNAASLDVLDTLLRFSSIAATPLPNESDTGMIQENATNGPDFPLPENLTKRIQQCRSTLHRMRQEDHASKVFMQKQREKRDHHLSKVRDGLRNYWKSLNLYIEINPEATEPHSFYGLHSGEILKFSMENVLRAGRDVLNAVENAEAMGYPVITLASTHDVFVNAVTELGKVMDVLARQAKAKTERKFTNEEVRSTCAELLRDVAADLRHFYRKYDHVDIREKLRAYGFQVKGSTQNTPTQATGEGQTQATDANLTTTDENQPAVQ